MLTDEENAALERLRAIDLARHTQTRLDPKIWMQEQNDRRILTYAMLRLYPEGHAEPVNEENLKKIGFIPSGYDAEEKWYEDPTGTFSVVLRPDRSCWIHTDGEFAGRLFDPVDMLDVMRMCARAKENADSKGK